MRRNRPLPALAGLCLLTISLLAGGVTAGVLTPEAQDRLRQVRFALLQDPPAKESVVPLFAVARGYALVLENLVAGQSGDARYWRQAAEGYVRLATTIGGHLFDLDRRVGPAPLPIEIRTRLRRVAGRMRALSAGGNGDLAYWQNLAAELHGVLAEQAQELHGVHDMIQAAAPDRFLPAHFSLYYLGVTMTAVAPSGAVTPEALRRSAQDQVALCRGMGLAVANYVRFQQQPVRGLLLQEAAALRGVKLQPVGDDAGWHQEAHRLHAVLEGHRAVLLLLADELR